MTPQRPLGGRRILIVEDEYYLATDAAEALQAAGAEVLGPCATEESAAQELAWTRPDAVVLDIDLGGGASFKLAGALKARGVPFLFVTGYDRETIPADFAGFDQLLKPVKLDSVVAAVARLVRRAALVASR
jgi:DNA-binding response OmpR family regulator